MPPVTDSPASPSPTPFTRLPKIEASASLPISPPPLSSRRSPRRIPTFPLPVPVPRLCLACSWPCSRSCSFLFLPAPASTSAQTPLPVCSSANLALRFSCMHTSQAASRANASTASGQRGRPTTPTLLCKTLCTPFPLTRSTMTSKRRPASACHFAHHFSHVTIVIHVSCCASPLVPMPQHLISPPPHLSVHPSMCNHRPLTPAQLLSPLLFVHLQAM